MIIKIKIVNNVFFFICINIFLKILIREAIKITTLNLDRQEYNLNIFKNYLVKINKYLVQRYYLINITIYGVSKKS